MAEVTKKKRSRRLKRSVRRTLGTLFLVSALAVAAVPTEGLQREAQAFVDTPSVYTSDLTWDKVKNGAGGYSSAIPLIKKSDFADIYTDETGKFQFAWLDSLKGHQNDWYVGGSADPSGAMILRYEKGNNDDSTLVIPETVSAFASYATNQGTNDVAVSQNHEVLYYMSKEYKVNTETETETDTDGNVIGTKTLYVSYEEPTFDLCNRTTISNWEWKEVDTENHRDKNGRTREQYMNHDFYYRVMTLPSDAGITYNVIDTANDTIFYNEVGGKKIYKSSGVTAAESDTAVFKIGDYYYVRVGDVSRGHQWICNQTVKYIGNQYLNPINKTDPVTGIIRRFEIAQATPNTTASNGIFAGNTNIANLIMSNEVLGVGNYSFYNTAIQTVTFGNGIEEIGHDAFAESRNLRDVTIPFYSNLNTISDRAFANTNIVGFVLPYSVLEIYDSAFEGCSALAELRFNAEGQEAEWSDKWGMDLEPVVRLKNLGCSVFRGCTALKEITLPESLSGEVHLDNFAECSALEHIKVMNPTTEFVGHDTYTADSFKNDVCQVEGKDIYFEAAGNSKTHDFTKENEIAFRYTDEEQQYEIIENVDGVKLTYQALYSGAIYSFEMSGKLNGKAVEIPSGIGPITINSIGAGGFGNTDDLEKIIIPGTISGIGDGAFKGCSNLRHVIFENAAAVTQIGAEAFRTQVPYGTGSSIPVSNPSLTFTGAIATNGGAGNVTAPFAYAMKQGDYAQWNNEISNDSQNHTYITYYSGWPALLEVKYNPATEKSMLTDYPTVYDLKDGKYTARDTAYNTLYKYPFMEEDYVEAITVALKTFYGIDGSGTTPDTSPDASGYAEALNNNLTNIVLPRGVESIEPKLFVEKEKKEIGGPNDTDIKPAKSLTAYGLYEVEDGAFQGFTNLRSVNLADSTKSLGAYAFDGCTGLSSAALPMTLDEIGLRPFKGCDNLAAINFNGNPMFTVATDIIYETDANGNKVAVVECLERRTQSVTKTEMAGIQRLYREAFMGAKVLNVDLSTSYIDRVPEFSFAYTSTLGSVTLPSTVGYIDANAFKNSNLLELFIPGETTQVDNLALGDGLYHSDSDTSPSEAELFWQTTHSFQSAEAAENAGVGVWTKEEDYGWAHTKKSGELGDAGATDMTNMVIYCEDDSQAKKNFADRYQIKTSNDFDRTFVVDFYDADGVTKLCETQTVAKGESAVIPDMTGKTNAAGEVFKAWTPTTSDPTCIMADTKFIAFYGNPDNCTITFYKDYTRKESFGTATVPKGTTKAELEASGQIPIERVNNYAASINRQFVSWMDMPEVFTEDASPYAMYDALKWTVTFVADDDPELILGEQSVLDGENAQDFIPTREGYVFQKWLESLENIKEDKTIHGFFLPSSQVKTHTVTYYEEDGTTVFDTLKVPDGANAPKIEGPKKEGYTFDGWKPAANLEKVTKDVFVIASYTAGGGNTPGGNTPGGNEPGGNGGGSGSGNGTTSGNGSGSGNGTTSGNGSSTLYTLTVVNGSGSGSYAAGSQPFIIANEPAAGYEFSNWTVDPANTTMATKTLAASLITMPASNVTVTAHYKKATGSSGSGTSASGNTNRPNGTVGTVTNGGTTVVIDKNGLSNTGVVSATVTGSSDNFVIKITDSAAATEAILRALTAEYGSDLSNIKYFPMDISLYDSTGTTKITDTSGLRISITLPLPDSLIPYAGNNKVAGVVNDRLDKLTPRFTTIDGVSCVTFVAEHFSPYVIYVDTSRLSDGTVADSTPKTGDGIHPKWFLSIGLACLSFVMFMQKDNRKKEKVKVKTRA